MASSIDAGGESTRETHKAREMNATPDTIPTAAKAVGLTPRGDGATSGRSGVRGPLSK
jgi:hypothetical protein